MSEEIELNAEEEIVGITYDQIMKSFDVFAEIANDGKIPQGTKLALRPLKRKLEQAATDFNEARDALIAEHGEINEETGFPQIGPKNEGYPDFLEEDKKVALQSSGIVIRTKLPLKRLGKVGDSLSLVELDTLSWLLELPEVDEERMEFDFNSEAGDEDE